MNEWEVIREELDAGWGFGDDLEMARAFVGDAAFLDLIDRFNPGEVIIAIGIERVTALLELSEPGPEPVSSTSAGIGGSASVSRAVHAAHQQLVARDGDRAWRVRLPPNAADLAREELRRLCERDGLTLEEGLARARKRGDA
jgi:hypothetical protein